MVDNLISIAPLDWLGILCAMVSGAIIGLERQMHGKPVGIRTSILVCLGTYTFVAVANAVASDITDPSRVIGQVVTGIGFLGAGVMLSRDGLVYGVTSASTIWVLAAIGVSIACNYYLTGVKLAILAVLVLVGVDLLENSFKAMQRGVHARIFSRRRE